MIKNKFFLLPKEEDSDANKTASELFISKYLNKHYEKIKNLKEDLIRTPSPEEIFFLQTESSFNAFTFIPLIAKAQSIQELYVSTYSINIRVIESLIELHDQGMIEKIMLLISDTLIKRNSTTYDLLSAMVKNRANMEVVYSWNHSKITLAKTANSFYVIEGSGNWSENALYEQYIFANSEDIFNFRKEFLLNAKRR